MLEGYKIDLQGSNGVKSKPPSSAVLPTHKRRGKGEKICTLGAGMLRFIVPVKFRQLVKFDVSSPVKAEGTCRDQTEVARHDSSALSAVMVLFCMTLQRSIASSACCQLSKKGRSILRKSTIICDFFIVDLSTLTSLTWCSGPGRD